MQFNKKKNWSTDNLLNRPTLYCAALMLTSSGLLLSINQLITHYPGNHYLPNNIPFIACVLIAISLGCALHYGRQHRMTQIAQELIYFFLVMGLIGLATNAIQYTPFQPIDHHILTIERLFHMPTEHWIQWLQEKPIGYAIFNWIYNSLGYQMAYIPLGVILAGHTQSIRAFYFLILSSTLFGFTFYYFFPTLAPASVYPDLHFTLSQHATALKFTQIHHSISPTTIEGGLIALPSFHVIWAWYCCYLLKPWPLLFGLLAVFNALLALACVILGWHYCLDILGSMVVILCSHKLFHWCHQPMDVLSQRVAYERVRF